MTRVRRSRHDLVSTRLPSATIRSPLMASVAAAGRRGSSVRMRPLTRSVSAAIPLPISFVEQTYHEHCSCEKCYLRQKTTTFCRGENSCIRPEIVLNDASGISYRIRSRRNRFKLKTNRTPLPIRKVSDSCLENCMVWLFSLTQLSLLLTPFHSTLIKDIALL